MAGVQQTFAEWTSDRDPGRDVYLEVYEFPITALTNYHEYSGLKQHTFIILQFCGSESQNGSHWAKARMLGGTGHGATFLLEDPGRICFLAFSASG